LERAHIGGLCVRAAMEIEYDTLRLGAAQPMRGDLIILDADFDCLRLDFQSLAIHDVFFTGAFIQVPTLGDCDTPEHTPEGREEYVIDQEKQRVLRKGYVSACVVAAKAVSNH
jgi:hypothetical protein